MFTIYTPAMVTCSQLALMVNFKGKIEKKVVSEAYLESKNVKMLNLMHYVRKDTKACEKLTSLLTNNSTLMDLTRLSPCYQTSSLESFHSVVIHYAPKSIAFSYGGMESRGVCYSKAMEICIILS